jgi:DNA-binding MarR family transcriptional regulator
MSNEARSFTDLDRVLHEPSRLMIASLLYTVEKADFLYLLNESGLTKGNLSAHLSKLEAAGYVVIEKTFRGKIPRTLIALTDTGRSAFEEYRAALKKIVDQIS